MGPAAIISAVKWGAVIAVLTLALTTFRSYQTDQKNLRDTLIQTNADKISAQAKSQELENVNIQLEVALQITAESVAASNAAITELKEQNRVAQETASTQKAVLDDVDRLQSIANQRTPWIETMTNRATKERFDELETLFNSP